MLDIKKTIIIPYPRQDIFNVVANVENYPKFIPWCYNSTIISKDNNEIIATLHGRKGIFKYSWTTKNILKKHSLIMMSLVEGPFKFLNGKWQFTEISAGCEVSLSINLAWQQAWQKIFFEKIFKDMIISLVDAFYHQVKTSRNDKS